MTKITETALATLILQVFQDTYQLQTGGELEAAMTHDTVLLNTGLDSLGFAILVTKLEEELDFDPFSLSKDAFYPQTFGEFVKFYHQNQPV